MSEIQRTHEEQSTCEWLIDALGGVADGPTDRVLARPSRQDCELIIPLNTRAATVSALHRNHDDRSATTRLLASIGRSASRIGMLHRAGGDVDQFPCTNVVKAIRSCLGEPNLSVAIAAGPPRRNRKPVLMLIRPDGETVGFAKVGWSTFTDELVRNEYSALKLVDGKLSAPLESPRPIEVLEVEGRVVAIATAIRSLGWTRPRVLTPAQIDTISLLGRRRCAVSELGWLQNPNFGEQLDESEQALERAVHAVRNVNAAHEVEVGLWHGDLNRWNLITTRTSVAVIDWEFSGLDRPVGQDRRHLRFEATRRTTDRTPAESVSCFVEQELQGRSSPTELAIYLADVAIRESRLSGQGWSGAMAGFRLPLTAALEGLTG